MTQNETTERIIDIADIDTRFRHRMIGQLFKHLEAGHSLQLVVDHDPQRLRFQLDFEFGARCEWSYLEQGPDIWRVRLRNVGTVAATEQERTAQAH